ncbi:MAG: hypothetical protein AAFX99_10575 [Myxococcota bacterium]
MYHNPYATAAAMGLLMLFASGCASVTTPPIEVGPREGFEASALNRVAVVPFYATDPFGLEPEMHAHMLAVYEGAAVDTLKGLGLEVLGPSQVRDALAQADRLDELKVRLDLDRPIDGLFEGGGPFAPQRDSVDDRSTFIKELALLLKVDAVLLGEVIYHTDARCEASTSSTYTPHVVVDGKGRPNGETVPCAVSHFQAKLLEPIEVKPIWYNRALREVRAVEPDGPQPDLDDNARQTVDLVLLEANKGLKSVFAAR